MKKILIGTLLAATAFMPMTEASARSGKTEAPFYDDIASFCDGKQKPPQRGVQWNGDRAERAVLTFTAGDYRMDGDADVWLWLYKDGTYFVQVGRNSSVTYGSDGDDMIEGRRVGGCSREQLSEILKRNGLLDQMLATVPEDPVLRDELEDYYAKKATMENEANTGEIEGVGR